MHSKYYLMQNWIFKWNVCKHILLNIPYLYQNERDEPGDTPRYACQTNT